MINTKKKVLELIEELLESNIIKPMDLKRFVRNYNDTNDPEYVHYEMEEWYKIMGIEHITGEKFTLAPCPFTEQEIQDATENQQIILCIPKGITRKFLGKLFRLDTWALYDPVVTTATETEDCWFRTSMSMTPYDMKLTGIEVMRKCENENMLPFSIERYLVFIGRMRYLTGKTPDSEYWIWLPRGRYDRSGMLMAGFDRFHRLNVHGWMPQFSASYLGARYGIPPASH